MVLVYTDRPATEFWKVFVQGAVHDRAEIGRSEGLKRQFFKYLGSDLQNPSPDWPSAVALTAWGIRQPNP
jgi:hypothetical protein